MAPSRFEALFFVELHPQMHTDKRRYGIGGHPRSRQLSLGLGDAGYAYKTTQSAFISRDSSLNPSACGHDPEDRAKRPSAFIGVRLRIALRNEAKNE